MKKKYIKKILKLFPDIAKGRKNFDFFEDRVQRNLALSKKYQKKLENKKIY
tara:strand:- start:447 stop:599 length:153 start_codon:yes stop_codon:yes gene_type:complete